MPGGFWRIALLCGTYVQAVMLLVAQSFNQQLFTIGPCTAQALHSIMQLDRWQWGMKHSVQQIVPST